MKNWIVASFIGFFLGLVTMSSFAGGRDGIPLEPTPIDTLAYWNAIDAMADGIVNEEMPRSQLKKFALGQALLNEITGNEASLYAMYFADAVEGIGVYAKLKGEAAQAKAAPRALPAS